MQIWRPLSNRSAARKPIRWCLIDDGRRPTIIMPAATSSTSSCLSRFSSSEFQSVVDLQSPCAPRQKLCTEGPGGDRVQTRCPRVQKSTDYRLTLPTICTSRPAVKPDSASSLCFVDSSDRRIHVRQPPVTELLAGPCLWNALSKHVTSAHVFRSRPKRHATPTLHIVSVVKSR